MDASIKDLMENGELISIFRRIGCIGDSLSSGEFEYDDQGAKGYWDYYDYSWGQYIARMTGVEAINISRGGQMAKCIYTECESGESPIPAINRMFDSSHLAQAYIIALGVNDIKRATDASAIYSEGVGTVSDVHPEDPGSNRDSVIGWYGRIIQRLLSLQPKTKFFLVAIPKDVRRDLSLVEAYNEQLKQLADLLPGCYFVDLYHDGPVYDEAFLSVYADGHMNAFGYQLTAKILISLISRIIRQHMNEFRFVQFIGSDKTPYQGADAFREGTTK